MSVSIDKAYLLVSTSCNDRCRYCIIRKSARHMDEATIRQALELVFDSPGMEKTVAIYGGEPLLRFDLVRKTAEILRQVEARSGKTGRLFIYSNALLLDAARARWLARRGIGLIASLDVCQELRPARLRSARHRATFPVKAAHLRDAIRILGPDRVCAASVLLPSEVGLLMAQVRYMTEELGCRVVKILPGLGRYHWTRAQAAALARQLESLRAYLLRAWAAGHEAYCDILNESLARAAIRSGDSARRVSVIEIYPNRAFGLSPCEFELPRGLRHLNDTDRYQLGSLDHVDARGLAQAIARLDREPRNAGLRLLSGWAQATARGLLERAAGDRSLRGYVERARRLVFA